MLHDYGFYKFEKFDNYIQNSESISREKDHLMSLFKTEAQFQRYDECSQMIGACYQLLEMRLKNKAAEARIGSKIAKKVFKYFNFYCPKVE